jgi:hypothetical protein
MVKKRKGRSEIEQVEALFAACTCDGFNVCPQCGYRQPAGRQPAPKPSSARQGEPTRVSAEQLARVRADWERIAGELLIELIEGDGVFICHASELACLRLEHKYKAANARAYQHQALGWRFTLDTRGGGGRA